MDLEYPDPELYWGLSLVTGAL